MKPKFRAITTRQDNKHLRLIASLTADTALLEITSLRKTVDNFEHVARTHERTAEYCKHTLSTPLKND